MQKSNKIRRKEKEKERGAQSEEGSGLQTVQSRVARDERGGL